MSQDLIKTLKKFFSDDVNYMPYSMEKISVSAGTPFIPIRGIQYVWARHNQPQTAHINSLNSKGVFVSNNNKSGIIELALLGESYGSGNMQMADFTGIPFPIFVTDMTTGGTSYVLGSACRRVNTPTWRRELAPSLNIYTYETTRLFISEGVRLPE